MTDRKGDWMQTVSGKQFYPLDPRPSELDIDDIAHALGNICRFGGHSKFFYSVAQHCCLVSDMMLDDDAVRKVALAGLMHDAAEAYIGDMVRPIKRQPEFKPYIEYEHAILACMEERYRFTFPWPLVNFYDDKALATEARDVMAAPPASWAAMPSPRALHISRSWLPAEAKQEFLSRFKHLYDLRSLTHYMDERDKAQ